MTTHVVSTTPPLSGATLVGDINAALALLATANQAAAAPTIASTGLASLAGYVWHDTTANQLKIRDQADTAWMVAGYYDETAKTFTPHINPGQFYAADTGTANHYAVAPAPAWPTYATGGPIVAFVAGHANDGITAPDLTVSGIAGGAKLIVRQDGSTPQKGDILTTNLTVCVWNQAAGNFALLTQKATPPAFIKGTFSKLKATSAGGVQTLAITADAAVLLDANNTPFLASAVSVTPSLAVSGAGGLDTGTVAASTWYAFHLVYNGSTLSSVFSLSETAPTMPTGYTFKVFAGYVRTDGSGNIMACAIADRRFQYINTGSGVPRLATGSTSSAWVAEAWANFAPPNVESMQLYVLRSGGGYAGAAPNGNFATTPNATNTAPIWAGANAGTWQTVVGNFVPESANVYFFGSQTGDGLFILGFDINF